MKDKLVISGGTGFLGTKLQQYFSSFYDIYLVTRNIFIASKTAVFAKSFCELSEKNINEITDFINGAKVVINLSGASIGVQRWTNKNKKEILESRINATHLIVEAIKKASSKPDVLISASGVGYYGDCKDNILTEESTNGQGFLAHVCNKWEQYAIEAESFTRVVRLRTGLVLDKNNGVLPRFIAPYKFFLGGIPGSGNQWVSWIHINDYLRLVEFIINHNQIDNAINAVSPHPVRMKDFSKILASVLNKPNIFKVPEILLKSILGESSELLLQSQKVMPSIAILLGFKYEFPDLNSALIDLLK